MAERGRRRRVPDAGGVSGRWRSAIGSAAVTADAPRIWFQVGLHCTCGIEMFGFSFSGVPGVVIGHNNRIAWGFTNLGPDVTDLYLERMDGDRVQVDAGWRDLEKRQETIKIAGARTR
jgi:penicillin amidase